MTKHRSGFGQGAKKNAPGRAAECWLEPTTHASVAVTVCPSRSSPRQPPGRCEPLRPSSGRGPRPPRRSQPSSRKGSNGRVAFADFEVGGSPRCAGWRVRRDERGGPVGRQGSGCADTEDPRCPVFRTRKDSFSPVDNGLTAPGRRSPCLGPLHAAGSGQTLRRAGRHDPVVEPCACTTGSLRKETKQEAMDPRGGNWRSRAPSRSTGFRFAPVP